MPTSLLELLLFAATLSPGFVFLKEADRRRPERVQTTLRETTELFVVGSSATLVSVLLVGSFFEITGLGSVGNTLFHPSDYVEPRLQAVAASVLAVYLTACLLAWSAARRIYGSELDLTEPSAWFDVFRAQLPDNAESHAIVTTKSGRRYTGVAYKVTPGNGPIGDRELVLTVRGALDDFPGQSGRDGTSQVILHGDEIESIRVLYALRA